MDDKDFIDGLKKAGRLDSALLLRKFSELGLSGKETIIAQKRYVEGLSFKEILPYLNMEERSMYRCHKNLKRAETLSFFMEICSGFERFFALCGFFYCRSLEYA